MVGYRGSGRGNGKRASCGEVNRGEGGRRVKGIDSTIGENSGGRRSLEKGEAGKYRRKRGKV